MRFVALFFTAFLYIFSGAVVAAVNAESDFPIRMQLKDYGIYQLLDRQQAEFSAESTAGYTTVIETRLVRQTQKIPIADGVVFGFNYSIADTSVDSEWVPVTVQVSHPKTSNYMGRSAAGFSQRSSARLKADGLYHNGAFYVLSEPYEMVPGEWLIRVIYRGEVVLSKTFLLSAAH